MNIEKATEIIRNIDINKSNEYLGYWRKIQPKNEFQYFSRFVFAICSIQAGWESNRYAYERVMRLDWLMDKQRLQDIYENCGVGLVTLRTKATWEIANKFMSNPSQFHRKSNESWAMFRNRMVKDVWGIGMAKISFVLEMAFPDSADVTCIDRHGFRLYGLDAGKNTNTYQLIESHWVNECRKRGLSPAITRHIYWDSIQKKENTRYWSECLESNLGQWRWLLVKAEVFVNKMFMKCIPRLCLT